MGRLRIGDSWLKVNGFYLSIGPNVPFTHPAIHFKGQNSIFGGPGGGGPSNLTAQNAIIGDGNLIFFTVMLVNSGSGTGPPFGDASLDGSPFTDAELIDTITGTSSVSGAPWQFQVFKARAPTALGEGAAVDFVLPTDTFSVANVGLYELEESADIDVVQFDIKMTMTGNTTALALATVPDGTTVVLMMDDTGAAANDFNLDPDWTQSEDTPVVGDVAVAFQSEPPQQAFTTSVPSGADLFPGILMEVA